MSFLQLRIWLTIVNRMLYLDYSPSTNNIVKIVFIMSLPDKTFYQSI